MNTALMQAAHGYLMRPHRTGQAAHIWHNGDTACRMWSTGGMSKAGKWEILDAPGGRNVCRVCLEKWARQHPQPKAQAKPHKIPPAFAFKDYEIQARALRPAAHDTQQALDGLDSCVGHLLRMLSGQPHQAAEATQAMGLVLFHLAAIAQTKGLPLERVAVENINNLRRIAAQH